ncbi:MAG: hypothetical protein HQ551_10455 [Desulfobacteraceae bacterium]|nr:hypothetical protein [Desulfobacteraceae bacterium]
MDIKPTYEELEQKIKVLEKALQKTHDELERIVEERTAEMAKANEDLKSEIKERKRTQGRLSQMNVCFVNFGPDPLENINRLTALCGELLNGICALYNRLDQGMLCSWGLWNTPPDYNPVDQPDGHICYDVIKHGGEEVMIVRNLPETHYARTDPNVNQYKLQTYIGRAVMFADAYVGSLCVVYQDDFIPSEEDKKILEIIASAIGVEEERRRAEEALKKAHDELERRVEARTEELKVKTISLEELNSALKFLLKQRDEDKQKLEEKVLTNVQQLVLPNLDRVKKSALNDMQKSCLGVLESNLNAIISPFTYKLSSKYINLTPAEIRVADLVKQGKSTKDIAMFLNLSVKTIERHRENIRKKTGLKSRKINLRSYLLTLH